MKNVFGTFKSKAFYIRLSIILLVASRLLVFSPDLWKLQKYKRKLSPPGILRVMTFSECVRTINSDRDIPSIKKKKSNDQNSIFRSVEVAFIITNEAVKTFSPYFGQYIDPPKLS